MSKDYQRVVTGLLSERIIAFPPSLARITGSVNSGLFLSQLLYWKGKGKDTEWTYKSINEFEKETTLTRRQQDTAIIALKKLKIIEVKLKGVPPTRHFKINWDTLMSTLNKDDIRQNGQ